VLAQEVSVDTEHVSPFSGLWQIICLGIDAIVDSNIIYLVPMFCNLFPWRSFDILQYDNPRTVGYGIANDTPEGAPRLPLFIKGLSLIVQTGEVDTRKPRDHQIRILGDFRERAICRLSKGCSAHSVKLAGRSIYLREPVLQLFYISEEKMGMEITLDVCLFEGHNLSAKQMTKLEGFSKILPEGCVERQFGISRSCKRLLLTVLHHFQSKQRTLSS
jgi:hypothetical protein